MAKAKLTDLAPLAEIRILLKNCQMALKPLEHQVEALPIDTELEYYFIPANLMEMFRPYYRPGRPFKNLKLINFERPAISLTFYPKHKYRIDQNIKPDTASIILKTYRDELYAKSFLDQLTITQQQELQRVDILLKAIRQAPNQFEFCQSNYHHYYRYWYCSFRYFEDDEQIKTSTANEHMLKHTQRTVERGNDQIASERLNIIFIDTKFITRPVPYDNKLVDRELETYPDRIIVGKSALYIRSSE